MTDLDKTARKIEILKLLHGEKMRIVEIAEYFDRDERTIRADINELRDGAKIFGTTFRIESKHEGSQEHFYKSTVHPIILGLNLSELFMLLKLLEDKSEGTGGEVFKNIFNNIYSQMTDYAETRIAPKLNNNYSKSEIINVLEEEAFEDSVDYKIAFWGKSGRFIEISYQDENEKQVTKEVKLIDSQRDMLKIEDKDGHTRWIDENEIVVDWSKEKYK